MATAVSSLRAALDGFAVPRRARGSRAAFECPRPHRRRRGLAIGNGDNTLVIAPTGSGKTLAAFLWAIDRLAAAPTPPTRSGAAGCCTSRR